MSLYAMALQGKYTLPWGDRVGTTRSHMAIGKDIENPLGSRKQIVQTKIQPMTQNPKM